MLKGLGSGDFIAGAGGADVIAGGGDDRLRGGVGGDQLDGGRGVDTLEYFGSSAGVTGNLLTGFGSSGDAAGGVIKNVEKVEGTNFDDVLTGNNAANEFFGGLGKDILSGAGGADRLIGSNDADRLTGGAASDTFEYGSTFVNSKATATRDVIDDFHHGEGDLLLLNIDADTGKPGVQVLNFVGSKTFTAPGQVRFFFEGDHTVGEANTAGNSGAEMQIQLDGHLSLVKDAFIFVD